MAGDKENPVPPEGQGEGAPPVEGATKMFSMKLDSWLSDFTGGDDLLGLGAAGENPAPADAAALVTDPLDIAPIVPAPSTVIIAPAPHVVLPGLIPPPAIASTGRSSSPDLLPPSPVEPAARISGVDLSPFAAPDLAAVPLIDPLAGPLIDPLASPIVMAPAPPPGVSPAAMMIGLPREQPEPPRSRALLVTLLVILVVVIGAAVVFFFFPEKLPFLNGN